MVQVVCLDDHPRLAPYAGGEAYCKARPLWGLRAALRCARVVAVSGAFLCTQVVLADETFCTKTVPVGGKEMCFWKASHGLQLQSLWIIPTAAVS